MTAFFIFFIILVGILSFTPVNKIGFEMTKDYFKTTVDKGAHIVEIPIKNGVDTVELEIICNCPEPPKVTRVK